MRYVVDQFPILNSEQKVTVSCIFRKIRFPPRGKVDKYKYHINEMRRLKFTKRNTARICETENRTDAHITIQTSEGISYKNQLIHAYTVLILAWKIV